MITQSQPAGRHWQSPGPRIRRTRAPDSPGCCCDKGLMGYGGARMLRAQPSGPQGIYPHVDKAHKAGGMARESMSGRNRAPPAAPHADPASSHLSGPRRVYWD